MKTEIWAILGVIVASIVGAWGAFFLKVGADRSNLQLLALRVDPRVVLGLSLYFSSSVLYIICLRGGELSVLYPIAALVYVWSTVLAKWRLNEEVNAQKMLGLVILMAGIILVTFSG